MAYISSQFFQLLRDLDFVNRIYSLLAKFPPGTLGFNETFKQIALMKLIDFEVHGCSLDAWNTKFVAEIKNFIKNTLRVNFDNLLLADSTWKCFLFFVSAMLC